MIACIHHLHFRKRALCAPSLDCNIYTKYRCILLYICVVEVTQSKCLPTTTICGSLSFVRHTQTNKHTVLSTALHLTANRSQQTKSTSIQQCKATLLYTGCPRVCQRRFCTCIYIYCVSRFPSTPCFQYSNECIYKFKHIILSVQIKWHYKKVLFVRQRNM